MNISAISIKNPIPVIMIFLLMTLMGLYSFNALKIQNFPDITLPTVTVAANLPGATPDQLENEVAKKIENSIATIEGLKNLTTTIQDGGVSLVAEFNLEKPAQEALDDVKSAVSSVRYQLPTDVQDPIIQKVNLSGMPILSYAIKSTNMNEEQLSWYVDNDIKKRLLSIKGVGGVDRVGGVSREVQVLINPAKLKGLGITAAEISRELKQIQQEVAAGKMEIGAGQQPIRTIATVKSASELEQIEIKSASGIKVKLSDIATIKDSISDLTVGAYLNGESVVGFQISKTKGAGEVAVAKLIQESLEKLKLENPNIKITEAFNSVTPVEEDYQASLNMLYEGALLAVLVVWLFLKDIRATLVSAIALPLSIMPAFLLMYQFDFSMNLITLLALSLVVGILVDDAIVEVENIERHMLMGKTPYQASMEATQEIGMAVVATTFTLIAVFLPTAFMSGVPGLFFKQFGWTAAIAVFSSLVIARILTPLMAAYLLKNKEHKIEEDAKWLIEYMKVMKWCLNNRFKTIIGAVIFFLLSLSLIPLLPTEFIPANDESQTQVNIELQPGVSFNQTRDMALRVSKELSKIESVTSVYTNIGSGGLNGDPAAAAMASTDVRKASITLKLKDRGTREKKQVIENKIRTLMSDIPGIKVKVGYGGNGEKYVISLQGEDGQSLAKAASDIEKELRTIPKLGNISSNASLNRTEVILKPDYAKAAEMGVNTENIANTLRIATTGDYSASLSKLNSSLRQVPIVVKLDKSFQKDFETLKNIQITGKDGMIPLSEIASIEYGTGPSIINRYNRERNVSVEVELSGLTLGEMQQTVSNMKSIKNLPSGVRIVPVGEAERMMELFGSFGLAMIIGILCIFTILVLLFKDFFQPITILAALPLSLGGAFLGLIIGNQSFSMPSLIGLIMLMGVATKNSILLVEYAIVAKENGMSRYDALVDACHKRARPIIMTTFAMAAGMLPLALQLGGADGSFRAPMAVAVIGGLITSTILSLLVIPAVFSYIDDFEKYLHNVYKRVFVKSST